MSRIVISVLCLQISLIHSVFSQYSPGFPGVGLGYGNPGFGNPGLGYGTAGMGMPAPGMPAPGMATPLNAMAGSYGGVGTGDLRMAGELPVAGTTAVNGQVPIVGAVEFRGNMPAGGVINISGSCGCTGKPVF